MSNQPFHFKQFLIKQDACAMKIGTDSVLLGAWAHIDHQPQTVLDIGAGSGVLALMIAQRSPTVFVEAIEIDEKAFEQCVENFENSPWSDRLFCYHASLIEFVEEVDETYDLIICNPPFYSEDYKTESKSRNLARFESSMPFEHLIYCAIKLLSTQGHLNVIIPFKEEQRFLTLAKSMQLFPERITRIKGNDQSELKRSLIDLSFDKKETKENILVIETERHKYTEDYIELTKDFYLNM